MPADTTWMPATEIAARIAEGSTSASAVIEATLGRIERLNPALNAFTDVVAARARARAVVIDAQITRGKALGPLAGVPFAVKNLFDIAGLPTRAGSKINRDRPAEARDAVLIERLEAARAVLVGGLDRKAHQHIAG